MCIYFREVTAYWFRPQEVEDSIPGHAQLTFRRQVRFKNHSSIRFTLKKGWEEINVHFIAYIYLLAESYLQQHIITYNIIFPLFNLHSFVVFSSDKVR